jgi:hypothetical protein
MRTKSCMRVLSRQIDHMICSEFTASNGSWTPMYSKRWRRRKWIEKASRHRDNASDEVTECSSNETFLVSSIINSNRFKTEMKLKQVAFLNSLKIHRVNSWYSRSKRHMSTATCIASINTDQQWWHAYSVFFCLTLRRDATISQQFRSLK